MYILAPTVFKRKQQKKPTTKKSVSPFLSSHLPLRLGVGGQGPRVHFYIL